MNWSATVFLAMELHSYNRNLVSGGMSFREG